MARTGESYTTARRHVAGAAPVPLSAAGYRLSGGREPVSAALAHVLAHHGVRCAGDEVSEELIFGVAGGPGAGYILWEFAHDDSRPVVLAFSADWQYADRATLAALDRLGVAASVHRTGGAVGAARALAAAVDAGRPALVWPDRRRAGYRHLPDALDGMGGHVVVAYGRSGDGYLVDDRSLAPLTVPAPVLDAARARVGSYRNLLVDPQPTGDLAPEALRSALVAGLSHGAAQLGGTSASFALPAWRKWARLVTEGKAAKGWPRVFADGRGLAGALASVWEGVSPAGTTGGHLRDLTADCLDAAGPLLGVPTAAAADAWRAAGAGWTAVGDAALPADVPGFGRLRELTATVEQSVLGDGDAGRDAAVVAAAGLWELRARLDAEPPLTPADRDALFAGLGSRLHAVHAAEQVAVRELAAVLERAG
ncbi:BtrH N-terminal domain-containing protein [Pseudonocardia sp. KRD-169]|uniref:BtrH N-terminal domain-containing protein n=2 Tax=Pseudonocardia abyssalis TaxID=2792008 RepID=A0ABS6UN21_9PSEU|nr:BtrH N-terminal domain-containing protein [Pseudonocardia abyssalis]MBW0133629.1 BtrH N-terminal domain-containing protein [Pseudonocardia abyssalis]